MKTYYLAIIPLFFLLGVVMGLITMALTNKDCESALGVKVCYISTS